MNLVKIIFHILIITVFFYFDSSAAMAANEIKTKRFRLETAGDNQTKFKKVYDTKLKRNRYFKNKFIVKFKASATEEEKQNYFNQNNLIPIKKISKRIYSCKFAQVDINQEALISFVEKGIEVNNQVAEELDLDEFRYLKTDSVANVHAAKKSTKKKTLVPAQWYLKSSIAEASSSAFDINADKAWQYTKGAGIIVAVIDTGFDLKHTDINYLNQGYDVINGIENAQAPELSRENHGTAVAGIIAAKDNDFGVVGVAPEAQIFPVRLITEDGMVSVSDIIDAHHKAIEAGATIINNSWGSYDPTSPDDYVSQLTTIETQLYDELANNANGGKGVVVVFAAGNSSDANFNRAPEARNENNFAVGAIDSMGNRASYSVYGDELDVVAPGGDDLKAIVTTDRHDIKIKKANKAKTYILGYDRGDYAMNFKGTSASAPLVSGIAALVWAANPNLTASAVKQIIKDSAHKDFNSAYNFDGNGFNNELGYGLVDAGAAVEQAL